MTVSGVLVSAPLILVLSLMLIGNLNERRTATAQHTEPVAPSKYDARLIELDREAIENAYRQKIEELFSVWLRDATGQPERALVGARNARRAYIDAMTALEREGK